MDTWYQPSEASFESIRKMTNLSVPVQRHLQNVYFQLSIMLATSATGAVTFLKGWYSTSQWTFLAGLACLAGFHFIQPTKENELKRKMLLLAFSFIEGLCVGPLVEATLYINPSIVPMALISTALVFISFSASAIFSARRSYIYLGGILSSAMTVLCFMSFANIFLGSRALWTVELYIGLIVFAGYVAYDSQLIIEKAERGSRDYMSHSLQLFVDAYNLFVRIMILLGKKEEKKKRDERRRN